MIRSLRLRLLLGTSVATALILGLLGIAIFVSTRRALVREFDAASLVKANILASMAELDGERITVETDQDMAEFLGGRRPEYFEFRPEAGGRGALRSQSLGKDHLPVVSAQEVPVYSDLTLPDGRGGRMVSIRFTPRLEHAGRHERGPRAQVPPTVLTLARETTLLQSMLASLRWLLVVLIGLAVMISGLVLLLVVANAMRSVKSLARDIESMDEHDLDRHLPVRGVPVELVPVVERLNALLARIGENVTREKAFTAEVAHELRTPLAGLHTTLEVCRSKPRNRESYEAMIDKCLKLSGGMRSIVETLLLLARADAGQLPLEFSCVDLAGLVHECWAMFQAQAEARGVRVTQQLDPACTVETDAGKMRIILRNLLDNAAAYVGEGGMIGMTVGQEQAGAFVEITNTGNRVDAGKTPHLFDRFWRGDEARSDTGVHCGLGLALCRRLADLLGARISAQPNGPIFTARFSIPLCPPNGPRA